MRREHLSARETLPEWRQVTPGEAALHVVSGASLPTILTTNRPLRDLSVDAVAALVAANDPPRLFLRSGSLVRVEVHDSGLMTIVRMGEDHLRGHLTRAADFMAETKSGQRHTVPSTPLVRDLLSSGEFPFPPLKGVISSPVVRPDGSILATEGYDPGTQLYYLARPGFQLPTVPDTPSAQDLAAAVNVLREVFANFPFEDAASRAHAFALLLTPVCRPMIAGSTPLAAVTAPQAGTGKGLLVEVASLIATGSTAAVSTAPRSEEEMRKRITTVLSGGQPVILFDNVEMPLASSSLAAAITAAVWQDRLLGHNSKVEVPVLVTWAATGNNLKLGGDLPRRCYWICLDAQMARPWKRSQFIHPNLVGYVQTQRAALLTALLTLIRAWVADGQPPPPPTFLGSFDGWARVVGGVLGTAGIEGFLANQDAMYEGADLETTEWHVFLRALCDAFPDRAFTAAEAAQAARANDALGVALREAMPSAFADAQSDRWSRLLGNAFQQRERRPYGDDGLRVLRVGTSHRALRWKVTAERGE